MSPFSLFHSFEMEMEPKVAKRSRPGPWKCFCFKSQRRVAAEEAVEGLHGYSGRVISAEEEDGVVRVRILMSKHELKQMMASVSQKSGGDAAPNRRRRALPGPAPQSLEQLMHALRRRQMKRAESGNGRRGWTPALQSIPEED